MPKSFSPIFMHSEQRAVKRLLKQLEWNENQAQNTTTYAAQLVEHMRARKSSGGALESFLQEYTLDTEEGLALMTLAEALLRIPDAKTANALIHDKVAAANWLDNTGGSKDWIVRAAGVGLFMTSKTLNSVISRVGEPFMRQAMISAMQILGKQFVLGQDIEGATQNAASHNKKGYRMSYDILGEGARTVIDADKYFLAYKDAIDYIGNRTDKKAAHKPGISVKLSALHPRYEFAQQERCIPELTDSLKQLCTAAADLGIPLTVDAEETPRLNTSIQIIENILKDPEFKDWQGFGLAVQAYHKAAPALIDHITKTAKTNSRRIQMRLVKGAYWDSEIKDAQVGGFDEFPVYTRKDNTDLSYMACTAKMFENADIIYPMIATHNAQSIAATLELNKIYKADFEFQRLFGMGEALYDVLMNSEANTAKTVSIYAPVGPHQDLLPYLVRRLLENGANTSFVNQALNPDASVEELVADPVHKIKNRKGFKHSKINHADDLFRNESQAGRSNSKGVDLNAPEIIRELNQSIDTLKTPIMAAPIIGGTIIKGTVAAPVTNPANTKEKVGRAYPAKSKHIDTAFELAESAHAEWAGCEANIRAKALERTADLLEENGKDLIALLIKEAGKTIPDAHDELREAIDFCRYYADQGRTLFGHPKILPGPTGESNILSLHGRGTFVCISPWNFPLAIFVGQISAALMAGNCVIAKPAEQTPLIAMRTVQLMHKAGIPSNTLQLILGDGKIGAAAVDHRDVAGVVFTGSTKTAQNINRALANKNGPIVPLIAETGGQNAMIVDSSALPEQVIDDVINSAFGSAGQRCSALRILYLQSDCADKIIRMLKGAMQEMTHGDPALLFSDIGPVIDETAHTMLTHHREALEGFGTHIATAPTPENRPSNGHFFAPCAYELNNLNGLTHEIFGPILHIVRYDKNELDDALEELRNTGYGLTLGIHSRIRATQETIAAKMPIGNVYINRSMTGAIVGSQPFGGMGLSGTGPKAGGTHYLMRFVHEKTISIDTTAAGGNATLVSLEE